VILEHQKNGFFVQYKIFIQFTRISIALYGYIRTFASTKKQIGMENIDNWLYWIIIIIAGISSLIGSINKKNKQAAESRQSREIITEDWEDISENNDETEIRQPVVPERQPATLERQPATVHDLHVQQKSYFNYKSFGKKFDNKFISRNETENAILYTNDDNAVITLEDLPTNTEEWRKAFIYNEIFKRKY
jgi:hypothetical protein